MRKWIVEFLRNFENRGMKIKRVNSILITKSTDLRLFTLISSGVGGPLWSKAIFRAQSICLKTFKNRFIKIARVNSIFITKSIDLHLLTLICSVLGVRCDVDIFKLTAGAQSIYREVNAWLYEIVERQCIPD